MNWDIYNQAEADGTATGSSQDMLGLNIEIEDKKLLNKFRKVLKDWTKADIAVRKEYNDRIEEEDEDTV